jgi:gem associated protein 5
MNQKNLCRIWSGSEGKSLQTLMLPQGPKLGQHVQFFITCHWLDSETLLSGGVGGELVRWHLGRPGKKGGYEFEILHRVHNRSIFSLCTAAADKGGAVTVYSVGQDRSLAVYDLTAGRLVYSLPSLNGFVYCLAVNPVEPNWLAVGAGDGLIRLWNLGSQQLFDVSYVRLNQAKVMSMAWHPTRSALHILFSLNMKKRIYIYVVHPKSK